MYRTKLPPISQGFTLIEILLVIGIIVLIAAVLVPQLSASPNAQLRSDSRQLVSALRETRLLAQQTHQATALLLNTDLRSFQIHKKDKATILNQDIKWNLTTAKNEIIDEHNARVRFYPDGSSNGATLILSNESIQQSIRVEWLTGRIHIDKASS